MYHGSYALGQREGDVEGGKETTTTHMASVMRRKGWSAGGDGVGSSLVESNVRLALLGCGPRRKREVARMKRQSGMQVGCLT